MRLYKELTINLMFEQYAEIIIKSQGIVQTELCDIIVTGL